MYKSNIYIYIYREREREGERNRESRLFKKIFDCLRCTACVKKTDIITESNT